MIDLIFLPFRLVLGFAMWLFIFSVMFVMFMAFVAGVFNVLKRGIRSIIKDVMKEST